MNSDAKLAGNTALMARMNRSSILRLVKSRGPISRTEIASLLGLNRATVGRIVTQLLRAGLLVEAGVVRLATSQRGGRDATLLAYNRDAGLVIGIDLSGFTFVGVLADLGGDFVRRTEIPPSPTGVAQENIERVCSLITNLLDSEPHIARSLRGIGVGCPGLTVNPEGIVSSAASLGWRNLPLKPLLEERFGHHVFVENDSYLGALAESLWGVGQGAERLVWLNVGPGVGAAIVIAGRLYQGAHCAAGEVGYMVPDLGSLARHYDSLGCMERLTSCIAVVEKARQAVAAGDPGWLRTRIREAGNLTIGDVFEAARLSDPLGVRLIDEMSDYLSLIIVNIVSTLDPDLLIIGPELHQAEDLFLSRLEARIDGVTPYRTRIVASKLEEAVVKGAVALALRATEEQFYVARSAFGETSVL